MAIAGAVSSSPFAVYRYRFPYRVSISAPKQFFPFESTRIGGALVSSLPDAISLRRNIIAHASVDGLDSVGSTSLKSERDNDYIPMPIVMIDQASDSDATIVQVSFGDRLGALIDTVKNNALIDLSVDTSVLDLGNLATGRKVEDPDLLERIRLTIINNLLKYHPESSERLAMGEAFGLKAPEKKLDVDIATHIHVKDDGPKRSLLCIETADRPGLLLEIIKIMADININVESAEIDTEGLVAKDKFHVSYRGAALNSSLSQVLTNCLRYYLRRPETDEDSY
ncbi:hypothetical protein C3L33_02679, partial [Rhododendron williamsianum]